MESQETVKKSRLAPVHYTILGLLAVLIGWFLTTEGAPGLTTIGLVAVIVGALTALTGIIRGVSKGWFTFGNR